MEDIDRASATLGPATVGRVVGPVGFDWSPTDLVLYALSVGARHPRDLAYLYEGADGGGPRATATFALSAVAHLFAPFTQALGLDLTRLLHAGQRISLLRRAPPSGRASAIRTVTAVWDKGSGALLECEDAISDGVGALALANSQWWVPGAGGFGGPRGPAGANAAPRDGAEIPAPPERAGDPRGGSPDERLALATWPEQPALHRLAGDHNPLHVDPAFARRAGQPGPILHGLCAFGMVGHALEVRSPGLRLSALEARFSAPVIPGDVLELALWELPGGRVSAEVLSGGARVLGGVSAELVADLPGQ